MGRGLDKTPVFHRRATKTLKTVTGMLGWINGNQHPIYSVLSIKKGWKGLYLSSAACLCLRLVLSLSICVCVYEWVWVCVCVHVCSEPYPSNIAHRQWRARLHLRPRTASPGISMAKKEKMLKAAQCRQLNTNTHSNKMEKEKEMKEVGYNWG